MTDLSTESYSYTTADHSYRPQTVGGEVPLDIMYAYERFMDALANSSASLCLYQKLDLMAFRKFMQFNHYVPLPEFCRDGQCDCSQEWKVFNTNSSKEDYGDLMSWAVDHLADLKYMFHLLGREGACVPWAHFVYLSWRWSEKSCNMVCHSDHPKLVFKYKAGQVTSWSRLLDSLRTGNGSHLYVG